MLRRAGTLLARQLNQTRSYSNKVRFVCKQNCDVRYAAYLVHTRPLVYGGCVRSGCPAVLRQRRRLQTRACMSGRSGTPCLLCSVFCLFSFSI